MSGKPGEFSLTYALDKSMNNANGEKPEEDRYPPESGHRFDRGWKNGGDYDEPRYRGPSNRFGYGSQRMGGSHYNNRGGYNDRGRNGGNYRHQSILRLSTFV